MTRSFPDWPSDDRFVRFTLSEADLAAAYRSHAYGRLWRWRTLVLCALVLVAFVSLGHGLGKRDLFGDAVVAVSGALGGLLAPLAIIRWRIPRVARRIYRQQRMLHDELTLTWDGSDVRFDAASGSSHIAWRDYVRWRADDHVILLYQSDALFQLIPRRFLCPAQAADLRRLAAAAGIDGAKD